MGFVHLPVNSDHSPILLNSTSLEDNSRRPFKFEAAWLRDSTCVNEVVKARNNNVVENSMTTRHRKLKLTELALKRWNKKHFGICQQCLKELTLSLDSIQWDEPSEENSKKEKEIKVCINEQWERLEMIWKQKSRQSWLQEGDRNTKFFHLSTNIRRRKNYILAFQDDGGRWITSMEEIKNFFFSNYTELFSGPSVDPHPLIRELFPKVISEEENLDLLAIPMEDEIYGILKEMVPLKSPGPDGFHAIFYTKCWEVVKAQVVQFVQHFYKTGELPHLLNHTFIVLIPKAHYAHTFNQFRPISLCNVSYKRISKLLANRLKGFLNHIISPQQSAFVPGRSIQENSVIGQEILTLHEEEKKGEDFHGSQG